MTLSNREKILLIVLGIIVILFVGVQFAIKPLYGSFVQHGTALLQDEMNREDVLLKVNGAQRMQDNASKSLSEADSAAQALLPSLDSDELDVWLSGFASDAGLKVSAIAFGAPVSTDISAGLNNAGNTQQTNNGNQTTVSSPSYKLKTYADGYKTGKAAPAAGAAQTSSKAGSSSAAPAAGANTGSVLGEPVTVTASGNYGAITAFMDKIKNSGKTVRVIALNCKPSGAGYTMTATIECYAAEKLDDSDGTYNWNLPAPAGQSSLLK